MERTDLKSTLKKLDKTNTVSSSYLHEWIYDRSDAAQLAAD